jgi:hypothetical protein
MKRTERLDGALASGFFVMLAGAAGAGQVVWPEGEEPNILVQWWINTARNNLAFWPAVITIVVVLIGIVGFLIRLRRFRKQSVTMRDEENAHRDRDAPSLTPR